MVADVLGNRLAQRLYAQRMRLMDGPIGQGLLSGLDDMGRRIQKVGVTAPKFDDTLKPICNVEHARDQMRVFQIDAFGQSGDWGVMKCPPGSG